MLSGKDLIGTVFAAAAVGLYYAKEKGVVIPLAGSYRAATVVVLIVGLAVCAFASSMGQSPWSNPWIVIASVLGGLALVAGLLGLIMGTKAMFATLVVLIVALWFLTTLRHLLIKT